MRTIRFSIGKDRRITATIDGNGVVHFADHDRFVFGTLNDSLAPNASDYIVAGYVIGAISALNFVTTPQGMELELPNISRVSFTPITNL